MFLCLDICHQILDLYSQGNKPIPQQMQEKERAAAPPAPAPPAPQGQPPATNPPPPPPKKTSPQGGSPARQLKRSHVSARVNLSLFLFLLFSSVSLNNQQLQIFLCVIHILMRYLRVSKILFFLFQASPKDEPKAPGKTFGQLQTDKIPPLNFKSS